MNEDEDAYIRNQIPSSAKLDERREISREATDLTEVAQRSEETWQKILEKKITAFLHFFFSQKIFLFIFIKI